MAYPRLPRLQRKRLQKLLKRLDRIKPRRFNMGNWCGTSCCLGGHAALMPEFKKLGLRQTNDALCFHKPTWPEEKNLWDADALQYVFGLTSDETHHLFLKDIFSEGKPAIAAAKERIKFVLERQLR